MSRRPRLSRLLPLLLLLACATGESTDFVLYKAAPEDVDGRMQARSLVVTGGGLALGVRTTSSRELSIRTGTVTAADWEDLRTVLAEARFLAREPATRGGADLFQVRARLGKRDVRLRRDLTETLEPEVVETRDRLEAIYSSLAVPDDPVAALSPFLASPIAHARGQAVNALLVLREVGGDAAVRKAADRAVRAHLTLEDDKDIVLTIRRALSR